MRHYVTLSARNFHLDEGFYPLGSCPMKHNPKLHERVAATRTRAYLHPLQDAEYAQGALELMWRLRGALSARSRAAARVAAAERGLARRAAGLLLHPRLPRGPGREPDQGAHARHGTAQIRPR